MPTDTRRLLSAFTGVLLLSAGTGAGAAAFTLGARLHNEAGLLVVAAGAAVVGTTIILWGIRGSEFMLDHFDVLVYLLLVSAPLAVSVGQYMVGPITVITSVLYVEVPILAMYLVPRTAAVAVIALIAVEFGVVLVVQGGYQAPVVQWAFLVGTIVAIGAIFGNLMSRALDEAEKYAQLRRFLAPQIADAVVSSGTESILEPHRRAIAVLFCDLRGFTGFSANVEPEDVIEVLQDYYRTVGERLHQAEATVGNFAGDGIMAYFNDPVACADPAGTAVRVACSLREPMETLQRTWSGKGFDLGYGIGIAYGYATLGTIGFEGRNDYTALGPVVNLAARLCGEALSGEILIDQRACDAAGWSDAVRREVKLKGYADPVTAFQVAALS